MSAFEDATALERAAVQKDRTGDVASAVGLYIQAAAVLSSAASELGESNPDSQQLLNHRAELLRRVEYLQSLFPGQAPQIPVESHISGFRTGASESRGSSEERGGGGGSVIGTAAALGGVAGLVLMGPLTAVAGAAVFAYASTQKGSAIGGLAKSTNKALSSALKFDKKHQISAKTAEMGSAAIQKGLELDRKFGVSETVKGAVASASKTVGEWQGGSSTSTRS